MKKKIFGVLMMGIILVAFCGCQNQADPNDETSQTPSEITELSASEAQVHEVILPWEFGEGEAVENTWYHSTVDREGNPVYAVMKASNNQPAYLPKNRTVVYTGNSGSCYYEQITLSYKKDGVPTQTVQYQLYLTSTAAEAESIDQTLDK